MFMCLNQVNIVLSDILTTGSIKVIETMFNRVQDACFQVSFCATVMTTLPFLCPLSTYL